MRKKLIELIKTASTTCPDGIHKCPDCEYYEKDAFGNPCNDQKRIADVLIANGVTIPVRCKDCKYGILDEESEMYKCVGSAEYNDDTGEFYGFTDYHEADFFCSDGERRTDD